jgi:hypothetical protein
VATIRQVHDLLSHAATITDSSSLFGAFSLTVHRAIRMLSCACSVNSCAMAANPCEQRRGIRNPRAGGRIIDLPLKILKTWFV